MRWSHRHAISTFRFRVATSSPQYSSSTVTPLTDALQGCSVVDVKRTDCPKCQQADSAVGHSDQSQLRTGVLISAGVDSWRAALTAYGSLFPNTCSLTTGTPRLIPSGTEEIALLCFPIRVRIRTPRRERGLAVIPRKWREVVHSFGNGIAFALLTRPRGA
jgi:hypothetical protein